MQIDLRAKGARGFRNEVVNLSRFGRSKAERRPWFGARVQLLSRARMHGAGRSREAKLQVEIARLKYVSPRLRKSLASGERRHGSGAGKSDLDLDRRKIRDQPRGAERAA